MDDQQKVAYEVTKEITHVLLKEQTSSEFIQNMKGRGLSLGRQALLMDLTATLTFPGNFRRLLGYEYDFDKLINYVLRILTDPENTLSELEPERDLNLTPIL